MFMKKLSVFFSLSVLIFCSLFLYYFIRYKVFDYVVKSQEIECNEINLYFSDATGLTERSKIKLAGFEIGSIKKIDLNLSEVPTVKVVACIYPKYFFLPIDTNFIVRRNFITQDAVIEVDYGIEPIFLQENDISHNTRPAMDIEKLLYKLKF